MKKLFIILIILTIIGVLIMLKPIKTIINDSIGNIMFKGNVVTGIVAADNGNKSYDVFIDESEVAYPGIFTLSKDPDLAVGDKVRILYKNGDKNNPIILPPTITASPIQLFESYLADGAIEFGYFYANYRWRGQTFIATSNHTINYVELLLARTLVGSVPGTIYVEIKEATVGDVPIGGILTSGTTDGNTLTYAVDNPGENREWRRIDLTEYNLVAGTKYAITLHLIGGNYNNSAGIWGKSSPWGADYPDGKYIYSADGGINWTSSFIDNGFKVYGKPL